jgi:quercetin dioxygenase-like cupin family protein
MDGLQQPRVILRGPSDGDRIILPMGGLQAHIARKASRAETGGQWSLGEVWQDPGFEKRPHTHDEAEAFYVLEGTYTFTRTPILQKESCRAGLGWS